MKFHLALLTLISLLALPGGTAQGFPITYSYAVSPDHPSTWAAGASNIHQALRWSSSRHMLFADVKYSTVDYASDANTTEVQDYTFSFPTVHFDPRTNRFTANGRIIGTLHDGLFGPDVVLDKNLELDVHRMHHGTLYAAINPAPEE